MLLPLLRTGIFGRQGAVAERFMRSSDALENNDPIRRMMIGSALPSFLFGSGLAERLEALEDTTGLDT
jgi:hypothetical protein